MLSPDAEDTDHNCPRVMWGRCSDQIFIYIGHIEKSQRCYFQTTATTVYCGQMLQHLGSHRKAIRGLRSPQFVVTKIPRTGWIWSVYQLKTYVNLHHRRCIGLLRSPHHMKSIGLHGKLLWSTYIELWSKY